MLKAVKYLVLILIFGALECEQPVFQAHRAGSWYPKSKSKLTKLLGKLSKTAQEKFGMRTANSKIRALISPHAGYEFSGVVAAAVYNLVDKDNIDRVIILAPSHFKPLDGIALPNFEKYKTPLGSVDLDKEAVKKFQNSLRDSSLVRHSNNYFKPEHAVEMQLPFIQYKLPNAKIVPIIVGDLSEKDITAIAQLLKTIVNSRTLVVVSSDFTHFGASFSYVPFMKNILAHIKQLDSAVLETIQEQDRTKFEAIIRKTKDTVCGRNPIRLLLELINQNAFGNVDTQLVSYGTSYDKTHELDSIVSYAGLITTQDFDTQLNKQEQESLLTYSRAVLEQSFNKKVTSRDELQSGSTQDVNPKSYKWDLTPLDNSKLLQPILTRLLQKPTGAFVTLWKINNTGEKELRGCIGQISAEEPLYKVVAEKTIDSAFHDSRFTPLKKSELSSVIIEISVLGKPRAVDSYKDIILNKHGIILTHKNKSALFLPKVPEEFGFNLTQTLEELSKKAGLDKNVWKSPDTKFQVFETQDFGEP